MFEIIITHIPHRLNPEKQRAHKTSLENLFKAVTRERWYANKKELPLWSPCLFEKGKPARNRYAIELSCMVFDFDNGIRFETVKESLDKTGLSYFAHSSYSNTKITEKFRVVLPLQEPICSLDWVYAWNGALEWLKSILPSHIVESYTDIVDMTCIDPRRFYYVGGCGKSTVWNHNSLNGDRFDLMPIMETTRERMVKEEEERIAKREQKYKEYRSRQNRKRGRDRDFTDELKNAINNEKSARQEIANQLCGFGGQIIQTQKHGEMMCVDFICPKCRNYKKGKYDPATYMYISPNARLLGAYCQHRNSCGWSNSLYGLALELNLDLSRVQVG
tara:strand:+ start:3965 stop:4960 length:996 start_codon:yes stop_codon:yes gene_type:complete